MTVFLRSGRFAKYEQIVSIEEKVEYVCGRLRVSVVKNKSLRPLRLCERYMPTSRIIP